MTKEDVNFSCDRNCFAYISKRKLGRFERNKPFSIENLTAHTTACPENEEFFIGNDHAVPPFYPDHALHRRPTGRGDVEALCTSQPAVAVPSAANYNLPSVDRRRGLVTPVFVRPGDFSPNVAFRAELQAGAGRSEVAVTAADYEDLIHERTDAIIFTSIAHLGHFVPSISCKGVSLDGLYVSSVTIINT